MAIAIKTIPVLTDNVLIAVSPYGGIYIIYYLCIRNQNSLIMEIREYFEKVMQDFNRML